MGIFVSSKIGLEDAHLTPGDEDHASIEQNVLEPDNAQLDDIADAQDLEVGGLETGEIDLSARQRNQLAEAKVSVGLDYFDTVITLLRQVKVEDLDRVVQVKDDLGLGMITANYTLAAALIQAHSHAIHHFASIGYIISQMGINLPDGDFGYNPTTPRGDMIQNS